MSATLVCGRDKESFIYETNISELDSDSNKGYK